MATLAQIRAAIKTVMVAVSDVGLVNDYERFAKSGDDFRTMYFSAPHSQIRGWFIRFVGREERSPYQNRYVVTNRWQIRGYMSLDDSAATEKTFNSLVESVVLEFRANDTLGDVVDTLIINDVAGAQVEDAGPVMFAGVLCHSARLALRTRHCE